MRWYESAGIGVVMAILYGLTLWASMDALSLVSFMNYGDQYYMPLRVTAVIMFFSFLLLFSVPIWYPFAEKSLQDMAEEIVALNKQRERKTKVEYPEQPNYNAARMLEQLNAEEEE